MQAQEAESVREEEWYAGRLFSRREALLWAGVTGTIWLMNRTRTQARTTLDAPQSFCIVRPEQTEGPYFVDERLHRTDIRSDPTNGNVTAGTRLALTFHISRVHAGECHPLPNAQIDVWHCDARGSIPMSEILDSTPLDKSFYEGIS